MNFLAHRCREPAQRLASRPVGSVAEDLDDWENLDLWPYALETPLYNRKNESRAKNSDNVCKRLRYFREFQVAVMETAGYERWSIGTKCRVSWPR